MEKDASREFMENLPELEPGKTFCFACHPEVPCFNRCCAELTLPLTPYDVLRLRRHMNNMPSEAFLNDFTRFHYRHPVAYFLHHCHFMCNDDNRDTQLLI